MQVVCRLLYLYSTCTVQVDRQYSVQVYTSTGIAISTVLVYTGYTIHAIQVYTVRYRYSSSYLLYGYLQYRHM